MIAALTVLLAYIDHMKPSMTTAMTAPIRTAIQTRVWLNVA